MTEKERLERLTEGFQQLSETGKEYILAISQALVFAQNNLPEPTAEEKTEGGNTAQEQ